MANEDTSKTTGRIAIGATMATVAAIVVGTSTSIYTTQRIESQTALSGAQITVQGASPSYILGNTAIGKSGTPNTAFEVVGTTSGTTVISRTLSGQTLKIRGTQAQGALCFQTGGSIGLCTTAINAVGDCTCSNP